MARHEEYDDDDRVVVPRDPLDDRLQALDAPEVQLALEPQLAAARADRRLGDLQDLPPTHAGHCPKSGRAAV